jgi:adenylate cyclase
LDRRLAAILAADIVGYSRLMGRDEEGTLRLLHTLQEEIIGPRIAEHHGRIFKLMGDGILAEFPSVVEAVRCAIEMQAAIAERSQRIPEDQRILYRIGINLGDIVVAGEDIFGDGVNVAARLEGLADPGGICVRRAVRNEVRDRLNVAFEDMGEIEVKNIARPVRAFRVLPGATTEPVRARVPAGRKPRRRLRLAAAAVASLVVVAAGATGLWWQPWREAGGTSGAVCTQVPDKPSVAILPFANLSTNQDEAYFADGLGTDLINQLSQVSGLFVIDRNSVSDYRQNLNRCPATSAFATSSKGACSDPAAACASTCSSSMRRPGSICGRRNTIARSPTSSLSRTM